MARSSDYYGTLDTSGIGSSHNDINAVTPVFKDSEIIEAERRVAALDPKDDSADITQTAPFNGSREDALAEAKEHLEALRSSRETTFDKPGKTIEGHEAPESPEDDEDESDDEDETDKPKGYVGEHATVIDLGDGAAAQDRGNGYIPESEKTSDVDHAEDAESSKSQDAPKAEAEAKDEAKAEDEVKAEPKKAPVRRTRATKPKVEKTEDKDAEAEAK